MCYRRHGHNEGDDPSYTQPLMYRRIENLRSVRKRYVETLVRRGDITMDEAESALADFHTRLQSALDETRSAMPGEHHTAAPHPPSIGVLPHVSTGVERDTLDRDLRRVVHGSRGLHGPPQARQAVRGTRRAVPEAATSTGRSPSPWPGVRS